MASCPSCSRANADNLQKCLYCGAALVDEASVARETAEALVTPRLRGRRGVVPVVLPGQSETANIDAVAALLGCEAFAARQALRRAGPLLLPGISYSELQATGLEFVALDLAALDAIHDPLLIRSVAVALSSLTLTSVDGDVSSVGFDEIACVFVGRVEVESSKEVVDSRFKRKSNDELHRVETSTTTESYDAFTVFDIYGPSLRARLVESVCTIEGPDYPVSRRGAGFARFAKWLASQNPRVHVDETYLQIGKEDRRSELDASGRLLTSGLFRSKEVVGTEHEYSGQEFDDYSVIAWTVWLLSSRTSGASGSRHL